MDAFMPSYIAQNPSLKTPSKYGFIADLLDSAGLSSSTTGFGKCDISTCDTIEWKDDWTDTQNKFITSSTPSALECCGSKPSLKTSVLFNPILKEIFKCGSKTGGPAILITRCNGWSGNQFVYLEGCGGVDRVDSVRRKGSQVWCAGFGMVG